MDHNVLGFILGPHIHGNCHFPTSRHGTSHWPFFDLAVEGLGFRCTLSRALFSGIPGLFGRVCRAVPLKFQHAGILQE